MSEAMISIRDVTIRFGNLVQMTGSRSMLKRVRSGFARENGAGKSTLMKILYGLYTRESGEIVINGKKMPRKFAPLDAIKLGVRGCRSTLC
jgi:ABC-type sugar transport system ATPase subunit